MKSGVCKSTLLQFTMMNVLLHSCSKGEDLEDIFSVSQNIPSLLCGTWYEVEKGSSSFQYLTINTDGTMEASYFSNGSAIDLREICYYNNGKMIFNYKNGGYLLPFNGMERTIVEWSSINLTLGYFNEFFCTHEGRSAKFYRQRKEPDLTGKCLYYQTGTATSSVVQKPNGSGNRTFNLSIVYFSKDIVKWFKRNNWIYVKVV